MSRQITCKPVNYLDPAQAQLLVQLLDGYAQDPLGGGTPLKESVRQELPSKLAQCPPAISWIAYCDEQPVGLINCWEGFSTFAARPLLNVHDCYVVPEFRGKGICTAMLQAVEQEAKNRGCCKLTLECLSGNRAALEAYQKNGFGSYELDPQHGHAVFMEKKLK
jgi:GNAT superfamily N-acetyltransferase